MSSCCPESIRYSVTCSTRGQKRKRTHPVMVVVRDGGHDDFVGLNRLLETLEPLDHRLRRADELARHAIVNQGIVFGSPGVSPCFLGIRERDCTLAAANASYPMRIANSQILRRLVIGTHDHISRDRHVGTLELARRDEGLAVGMRSTQGGGRADVVAGSEPEAESACHRCALPRARTQDPRLHPGSCAGDRMWIQAVLGTVRPFQQSENVLDEVAVFCRLRLLLLQHLRRERYPGCRGQMAQRGCRRNQ